MRTFNILLTLLLTLALPCRGEDIQKTGRSDALVKELLTKIDSTAVYAARREQAIDAVKSKLPGNTDMERYDLYHELSVMYSNYLVDSSIVYMERAVKLSQSFSDKRYRIKSELSLANILADSGFYTEAHEIITAIDRHSIDQTLLIPYYRAQANLLHKLYSSSYEPVDYRNKYRAEYNIYRDSLLAVTDSTSDLFLQNMEKKEARAGNIAAARKYNAIRLSRITDKKSASYATCLYDRFVISYLYERKLTGAAIDDVLESAIIEVEHCNKNIASLLRVESMLLYFNDIVAAKKVSDYYYSSLLKFGSRRRIIEGVELTLKINDQTFKTLERREYQIKIGLAFVLILLFVLVFTLLKMNSTRLKLARMKDDLDQSSKISKGYVGVVFRLYSSYIKRLEIFRTKIHTTLRKGQIEQALELTSPLGDNAGEDRRELFHNFDTAFVDIFPDFIQKVNACLKPEAQIIPKKTEILNTELRILAIIKLGIEDSSKIAEMLHCSVKTVYNLRSGLKARLAIPEEEFNKVISEI